MENLEAILNNISIAILFLGGGRALKLIKLGKSLFCFETYILSTILFASLISWIWIRFQKLQKEVKEELKKEEPSGHDAIQPWPRFYFQLKINDEAIRRLPVIGRLWDWWFKDPETKYFGRKKGYPFIPYYFTVWLWVGSRSKKKPRDSRVKIWSQ